MSNVANKEIVIVDENNIKDKIYLIRGQKVMLDFDLAEIYGFTTKRFNQQINRNIERFPDDFMFQITKEESDNLARSHFATSRIYASGNDGGRRYLPYAFTEQGIYMLMTILKGDVAIKQSIALIKAFKTMKDYISNNNLIPINEILKISEQTHQNTNDIAAIKEALKNHTKQLQIVMENFNDPNSMKHFLILNGDRIDADIAYQKIYSSAKESVIVIDDYIGLKTLELLRFCNKNVKICIISDNVSREKLSQVYIDDFISDTGIELTIEPTNNTIHDRYIIIDYKTDNEKLYHCGPSSKDAGVKISTITQVDDIKSYHPIIDKYVKQKI